MATVESHPTRTCNGVIGNFLSRAILSLEQFHRAFLDEKLPIVRVSKAAPGPIPGPIIALLPGQGRESNCPVTPVVSMGHRNTRRKSQVQEFQRLRIIREHKSKEKASCLGKSELQTQRIGPLETYCQIK